MSRKSQEVGMSVLAKWWCLVVAAVVAVGTLGAAGCTGVSKKAPEPAAQEERTAPENTADDAVDDVIDAATDLVSQTPSDPEAPAEYRSALNQADTYANRMHMSKQGIYDQLTSEYGEQFTAEEADYAVSNL